MIAETLQQLITELVDVLNPSEAAYSLYGFGIISDSERNAATFECVDKRQRSSELIKNLVKKLRENPHWFRDACKALDNTGARLVVDKLRGMNRDICILLALDGPSVTFMYTHSYGEREVAGAIARH